MNPPFYNLSYISKRGTIRELTENKLKEDADSNNNANVVFESR